MAKDTENKRGFAAMPEEERKEAARRGGQSHGSGIKENSNKQNDKNRAGNRETRVGLSDRADRTGERNNQ